MIKLIQRLWKVMTARQRRGVGWLSFGTILLAVAEVLNVSAIAPFLALVANPSIIEQNAKFAWVYEACGFESTRQFLIAVGLLVFFLMLVTNILSALITWAQLRFVWSLSHQFSFQLLGKYLLRPYSYFLSRNSADLSKTLLSEVSQVTELMVKPVILALGKFVVVFGVLAVLIWADPMMALLVSVMIGGSYLLSYRLVRRKLDLIGRDRVNANRERFTIAGEAFGGIKEVKVLNVEHAFCARFEGPSYRFSRHQAVYGVITTIPRNAIETVAFGSVVLVIVFFLLSGREFTELLPMLGLYAFAGYRLLPSLQQIFQSLAASRFSRYAAEKMLDDLEEESASPSAAVGETVVPLTLHSELELKGVTFTYPTGERPAAHNISLKIAANSTVGFVGPTGSGKTTLADVILGLLPQQSGEILVDGVAVTPDNMVAWQRSIGYVPQFIFLGDSSIAENIAFGIPKKEIDMDAVRNAAKIAQLDQFVTEELSQGYDTVVGERGVRLSGGQRQRIGIARALYRNPSMILFDEATSALDNQTEDDVMDALRALQGKKTIIMIAHRLSTLEECDTLFAIDKGVLVAQGSYKELFPEGHRHGNYLTSPADGEENNQRFD